MTTGSGEISSNDDDVRNASYGHSRVFDPSFNGPIKNRGCTDVICCIIFAAFLVGLCIVAGFAYSKGDPSRLLHPTDTYGNICGKNNVESDKDFTDKPSLFFHNLLACASLSTLLHFQCQTPQICIAECPQVYVMVYSEIAREQIDKAYKADFSEIKPFCVYGFDEEKNPSGHRWRMSDAVSQGMCPQTVLKSKSFGGRCIPAVVMDLANSGAEVVGDVINTTDGETIMLYNQTSGENVSMSYEQLENGSLFVKFYAETKRIGERLFNDFKQSWYFIAIGFIVAMLLSFILIVLMRYIAGPMIWTLMILSILSLSATGFTCFLQYKRMIDTEDPLVNTSTTQYAWLGIAIATTILAVVFALIVLCMFSRIRLAIQLVEEGSKCVQAIMSSLFFPIVPYVMIMVIFIVWLSISVFLVSIGTPVYELSTNQSSEHVRGDSCMPDDSTNSSDECVFIKYGSDKYVSYFFFYNLFALFWTLNFASALCEMTLAGAFASWYFAFNKDKDLPNLPILSSFGRSLFYHMGSLAFGSLIIAIVQVIRVVLDYMDGKLRKCENTVARFLLKCFKCCFWCLEKLLRFINRNAYIVIAIYGRNFCFSAKDGFMLLMRNILRVSVLNSITSFLLFLGKILVVSVVTVFSYFFFTGKISLMEDYSPTLTTPWFPVVILCFGSYLIAATFFEVYDMAIDTIFLCFLEDLERNDGSPERPYFMSKSLMKLIRKKQQAYSK